MATSTRPEPVAAFHPALSEHTFFRLSVAHYHEMGESGILTPGDRVELLDGYLVNKPMQKSVHGSTVQRLTQDLLRNAVAGWCVRIQLPITLPKSEPEPDGVLARGDRRTYDARHPQIGEIGLVAEVSDSTLRSDREWNGAIYASANIPRYWIVNLVESKIEVYTHPTGHVESPGYTARVDYVPGQLVPLILDGIEVASISVVELLP